VVIVGEAGADGGGVVLVGEAAAGPGRRRAAQLPQYRVSVAFSNWQ
jgi:hypothetical protein